MCVCFLKPLRERERENFLLERERERERVLLMISDGVKTAGVSSGGAGREERGRECFCKD